jgi:hypothetical protein
MDNLDEFDVAVARILADLLEAFPVPRSLNYTLADERPADVDRDVINATVEWLAAEGLLRVTGAKHGGNT